MRSLFVLAASLALIGCSQHTTRRVRHQAKTRPVAAQPAFDWTGSDGAAAVASAPPDHLEAPEPFVIDEAAFEAAMPDHDAWADFLSRRVGRRVQMVIALSDNCPACVPVKRDAEWFQRGGWVFGEDPAGHVRLVNLSRYPGFGTTHGIEATPTMILFVDGVEVWRAEKYTGREDLMAKFNVAVRALPPLMAAGVGQESFQAGEIMDPELVDMLLAFFGDAPGPINLVNDEYSFEYGSTKLSIPSKVAGEYFVENGVKRIVFQDDKKPRGKWRFISSSVDAVALRGTVLTLELTGLPDPSIDLKR